MAHFAKIENGVVVQVVVAEEAFIATGALGDPANWVQTSYLWESPVPYPTDDKRYSWDEATLAWVEVEMV